MDNYYKLFIEIINGLIEEYKSKIKMLEALQTDFYNKLNYGRSK